MTLVQLRHFLSIAETGSFTRSARACFLTQSALSRSLRALEDELGQPLFDRIGRRSEPTPFGRSLLERARQLVHDADALAAAGLRATGAAPERLRVGMGSGPGALLTPALLQRAARPGAGLRIDIQHGDVPRLVEALRRRELDALVVEVRSFPPLPGLRIEPVVALRGAFMSAAAIRWRGGVDRCASTTCSPTRSRRHRWATTSCAHWSIPTAPPHTPTCA